MASKQKDPSLPGKEWGWVVREKGGSKLSASLYLGASQVALVVENPPANAEI